jgi:uncharacterized protein
MTASGRLQVYVQPRASKTAVVGTHEHGLRIRVAAPPVDDAANRALVKFVAERLGLPKRCVRVISGATGRRKILEIDGVTSEAATAALLTRSGQRKRK